MCKLQEQAMERAGETGEGLSAVFYGSVPGASGAQPGPYLPGAMFEIADNSVRGNFVIGNVTIRPDGLTVDGQTVTDAGEIYAALTRALSGGIPAASDQTGAAVRGEAVAESDLATLRAAIQSHMNLAPTLLEMRTWKKHLSTFDALGRKTLELQRVYDERGLQIGRLEAAVERSPVSARAADAPSEPSELAALANKWHDELPLIRKFDVREEVKRYIDSEIAKSRAADALDSQPTNSSMPVDMSQAKRWIVQLRGRVDALLAIINEKVPAASQPQPARQSIGEDVHFISLMSSYLDARQRKTGSTDVSPEFNALCSYIDSRASAAPVKVDGWKLVPIKPTPKMVDSTWNDNPGNESHNTRNQRIYAAMVAAAPAPQQEGSEAGNG